MSNSPLISVVEDDDSVRESLRRLIRSVGYAIQAFSTAEQFLNSDQLRQTRCLILDVKLPGIDGLELQRQLIANRFEIPIIFITAHGDDAARVRALRNGALEYLFKPFSEEALLDAIHMSLTARPVGL
ncbi:MAG TPA: response regulator [Candidatus Saccharimonadales bacterium]|nr:response regulator [Candidatus Saccharimonadales bacterium]